MSVCIGTYSFSILGGCFHEHFLVFSLEFNFTHVVLRVRVRACVCVCLTLVSFSYSCPVLYLLKESRESVFSTFDIYLPGYVLVESLRAYSQCVVCRYQEGQTLGSVPLGLELQGVVSYPKSAAVAS